MTNVEQNVYPKDLTMSLASNHIEREVKAFSKAEDRIFVPDGGPFFSQSLIIKDSNGRDLKPQLDYKLLYLNEGATLEAGRDIVSVIWVMKETITSVLLDYRVVGGDYGNTVNAIMQEIKKAGPIQKNVDWNVNVYGKPHQFPPAPHFHTPDTFTGWQMVYEQLEGIRKAIITGDDVSWEAHYNYINRLMNGLETNLNSKLTGYATHSQVSTALSSVKVDVDLTNYYTKAQADSVIKVATDKVSNVSEALINYYTKTQSDSRYPLKTDNYTKTESDGKYALKTDYYTKGQSDGKYLTSVNLNGYFTTNNANLLETRVNQRIDTILGGTQEVDLSNYYTKGQVYTKTEVYSKDQVYTKGETYTKTEVNTAISNIPPVNLTNYYTKTQTYSRIEVDNKITTVVNNIPEPNLSGYYTKAQVLDLLENAITSATVGGQPLAEIILSVSTTVVANKQEGWAFGGWTPTSYKRWRTSITPDPTKFSLTLPASFDPNKHKIEATPLLYTLSGKTMTWTLPYSHRVGSETQSGYGGERFPYTYYIVDSIINVKILNK